MTKVVPKKNKRKKRTFSQQVWIVLSVLLAVSMVLSTVVFLFQ